VALTSLIAKKDTARKLKGSHNPHPRRPRDHLLNKNLNSLALLMMIKVSETLNICQIQGRLPSSFRHCVKCYIGSNDIRGKYQSANKRRFEEYSDIEEEEQLEEEDDKMDIDEARNLSSSNKRFKSGPA
jgi:hypothetical protein